MSAALASARPPAMTAPTAYVTNSQAGTVTPIVTGTNTPGKAIPAGKSPSAIAITPDGKTAYVTIASNHTVTLIITATNTPGKAITVGKGPQELSITP
jgi:hyaluronoglucosaminidase